MVIPELATGPRGRVLVLVEQVALEQAAELTGEATATLIPMTTTVGMGDRVVRPVEMISIQRTSLCHPEVDKTQLRPLTPLSHPPIQTFPHQLLELLNEEFDRAQVQS